MVNNMAALKVGQIIKWQFTAGSSVCTVDLGGSKGCLPDASLHFTFQQYALLLHFVPLVN